jgi:thiosulfate reductase cytochrome b subunit
VRVGEKTPTQLGPLERANLNYWTVERSAKQTASGVVCLMLVWLLSWLNLRPWRWRQYFFSKSLLTSTRLDGITWHNIVTYIVAAVSISYLMFLLCSIYFLDRKWQDKRPWAERGRKCFRIESALNLFKIVFLYVTFIPKYLNSYAVFSPVCIWELMLKERIF